MLCTVQCTGKTPYDNKIGSEADSGSLTCVMQQAQVSNLACMQWDCQMTVTGVAGEDQGQYRPEMQGQASL